MASVTALLKTMGPATVTAEEICEALDDMGFESSDVEAKVIDRFLSLCTMYDVDADKISSEYLAFLVKKRMDLTSKAAQPSIAMMETFDREVLSKLPAKRRENAKRGIRDVSSLVLNNDTTAAAAEEDDSLAMMYGVKRHATPESNAAASNKKGPAVSSSPGLNSTLASAVENTPTTGKYSTRSKRGETVISFGTEMSPIADWKRREEDSNVVSVSTNVGAADKPLQTPYRFMFEGLRDKAGFLDETICRLGEAIAAKESIEEAPQEFFRSAPDSFYALGRICCDATTDGARLNAHSILLQGNQDINGGRPIPLSEAELPDYAVFPGQVALVEACNPTGRKLNAKKIHTDASPPGPERRDRVAGDHALNVFLASGPYTPSDNLDYVPLSDLLAAVVKNRPHVAILVGPFVDDRHGRIAAGETDGKTYKEIFAQVMTSVIEAAKLATTTKFVLVPSHHDAHHKFIYPTPPFPNTHNEEVRERIVMVPDPAMFSVDGVVFGLTSADVLFHLGKEELARQVVRTDRIKRLASHLIQQRSFYPLFPPNEDLLTIDYEKLEAHGQISVRPHVLVLPSDLQHFYKDLGFDGGATLAVNPGRLTKKEGGGVYARIRIRPRAEEEEEEAFVKRVAADIVRI